MFINSIVKTNAPLPEQDAYLRKIPAISGLSRLDLNCPVTFLVGENGSGKSTLLEAVAVAFGFNPEGGSRNFHFSTEDTHSALSQLLCLYKGPYRPKDGFFLRAESFYNAASEVDRLSKNNLYGSSPDKSYLQNFGGKSLHQQSNGESFLALVLNRFWGNGLYLLDEPEAALSPARQLTLLSEIHRLVKKNSQLLIATHSPILMAYPDAEILLLSDGPIRPVAYEDTEHYQITKSFLENPQRMLRILLEEEPAEGAALSD